MIKRALGAELDVQAEGPSFHPRVTGEGKSGRVFTPTYQRLGEDPSWTTHALEGGHNLMRDTPQDLLKILLEIGEPDL